MLSRLRFTLLLPVAALLGPALLLIGCGAGTTNPGSGSAGVNASLSGDWLALQPSSGAVSSPVAIFTGALQFNGSSITGTLRAISLASTPCVSGTQDLAVTGTFSSAGVLTLSLPVAGGTATIAGTIIQPNIYNPATLQIVGGNCAMASTPVQLAQFVPITGTFAGTLSALTSGGGSITGSAITVSATMNQSATPNADGQFPITGTVTATGNCVITLPLTGYIVSGGVIQPTLTFGPPFFSGGIIPTGNIMIANLFPSSCPYATYSGTLTKQ